MAKGYWIARVDVHDDDAYGKYRDANAAAFGKYGARFLVRGGKFETMEGSARARNVIIEFDSYEKAMECYRSPEYQHAIEFRSGGASEGDLIVIEGYDAP